MLLFIYVFQTCPNYYDELYNTALDSSLSLLFKVAYLKFFSKRLDYLSFKFSKHVAIKISLYANEI